MELNRQKTADLVLTNGCLYTVLPKHRIEEAMAVVKDRIVFIGDNSEVQSWIGSKTRIIDLQEKMVLPGFVDSHCHITSGVCEIYEPILHGITNIEGYQQSIRSFLTSNPGVQGIQAGGWTNAVFDKSGPTKDLLDEISINIPIVLYSEDYHNAWVNTKTLDIAGITAQTPNPSDGIIERDSVGNPSGTLRESALELIKEAILPYNVEQVLEGLIYFQKKAHRLGITSVYNPLVSLTDKIDLQALQEWERSGGMKMHIPSAVEVKPQNPLDIIENLSKLRKETTNKYFQVIAAKIFMDGVLEGSTAYLEQPYLHDPKSRGILNWDPDDFNQICIELDKAGFQIHVHSIGDAATRITLDGFAESRRINGKRDSRHGITHIQLVHKSDIERFLDLGVTAIPQPFWFLKDTNYTQMLNYIGLERASQQYPMNSFFEKGVLVASASDYNVTLCPNPLLAIELGVTRKEPNCSRNYVDINDDDCLMPSERVSVEEMIESFTINGAHAAFLEKDIGSLEVGKKADFIILDQNITEIPPTDIHFTKVLSTFFEGQEVFSNEHTG